MEIHIYTRDISSIGVYALIYQVIKYQYRPLACFSNLPCSYNFYVQVYSTSIGAVVEKGNYLERKITSKKEG